MIELLVAGVFVLGLSGGYWVGTRVERLRIVRWLWESNENVSRENATLIAERIEERAHLNSP